jgi:5-(carboxyamino)imidazole ribonucleotide synthase
VSKLQVGILGGGQLARMLALEGYPLGISMNIMTASPQDPAAQVTGLTHLGSLSDPKDLRKFMDGLTALTFESEFVDIPKLKQALPSSVYVFPNLDSINQIQDRLAQKRLLDRFEIPTSPWLNVENGNDLTQASLRFKRGFVLKQRRFGYDGYGTFVIKPSEEPDPLILQRSQEGFIAEDFIAFKRELAVSFVRGRDGEFIELPLVETEQKNSRCVTVVGPVKHRGLARIARGIKKMMEALDYVGILAVEMFETKNGLLVNELAPRVHNSAHYSLDGLTCSQFEYHLRAGLGLPLPKVALVKKGFAMVNLLGEGGSEVRLSYKPIGGLHWYGKSENRKGRKLGHINVIDQTPRGALAKALKWRKEFSL